MYTWQGSSTPLLKPSRVIDETTEVRAQTKLSLDRSNVDVLNLGLFAGPAPDQNSQPIRDPNAPLTIMQHDVAQNLSQWGVKSGGVSVRTLKFSLRWHLRKGESRALAMSCRSRKHWLQL